MTTTSNDLTGYEGEMPSLTLKARASRPVGWLANLGVVDATGVIAGSVSVKSYNDVDFQAEVQISKSLRVGTHSTTLEVRLCEDEITVCKSPLPGSPWKLPLKATVKPLSTLTPLRVLPQVSNWSTYQGNAAHTGYVAASFDPKNFSRRWLLAEQSNAGLAVTHENGAIFMSYVDAATGKSILAALSEDSGKELWRSDLGRLYKLNPPAAAKGKVFVMSSGHGDSFFWVFSQATGALLGKQSDSSQWQGYRAPTVFGDEVYSNSGYYGGMVKYSASTHEQQWFGYLPQYDGWTPAVDGQYAYAYVDGLLHALNTNDGKNAFQISDPLNQWSGYAGKTPVLTGKGRVLVISNGNLLSFDLSNRVVAWTIKGTMVGQPVYAKDVVYVLNAGGTVLEARSLANGSLRWTSANLPARFSNVIVTDNLAFVSSDSQTLAIDLATQKIVWEHPFGGELSISDRGVLYVSGTRSRLSAVNLQ